MRGAEKSRKGTGRRRWLGFLFKVVVSAALMAYLLLKTDWRQLGEAFHGASLPLLTAAALLHIPGYYLSALRWRVLLRAQGGDDSLHRLVASYMVGTFFNNFLPTGIGGDVSRVFDTVGSAGGAARSVAVVLVERATGLIAVFVIGCAATVVPWSSGPRSLDPYLWGILAALAAGFAVVLSRRLSAFGARALRRLHLRGLGRVLADVAERVAHFRGETRTLLATFLYSVLLQLNVVLHCALVGYAMGIRGVPWLFFAKAVPMVTLILFLPVAMGGLGVRENAWVRLLLWVGLDHEEALAYSLALLAMVLAPAIAGGIVYALRRDGRGQKSSATRTAQAAAEEERGPV